MEITLLFKFMPHLTCIIDLCLISFIQWCMLSVSVSYPELCLHTLMFFSCHYPQCCFFPLCQNKALFHQLSLKETWQPTRMAQRQNKEGKLIKYSLLFSDFWFNMPFHSPAWTINMELYVQIL